MQTSTACDFFRKYEPFLGCTMSNFSRQRFLKTGEGSGRSGLRNADLEGVGEGLESKCRLRYSRAARSERARAPCRFIRKSKKVARFTRCKTSCHPLHRRERRLSFSRHITARCRALPVARDLFSLPPGRLTRSTTFLHPPREV